MDISVSRLNNRLALQLPAELPLGLVFVVGTVNNLNQLSETPVNGQSRLHFDLVEAGHELRCVVTDRVAAEVEVNEGDRVRAGGHLTFDPHRAVYYLMARDLELIESRVISSSPEEMQTDGEDLAAIMASAGAAPPAAKPPLAQADLPDWVRKIAPPEVKAEMAPAKAAGPAETEEKPARASILKMVEDEINNSSGPTADEDEDEDLMAYLVAAMDSEDDVDVAAAAAEESTADEEAISINDLPVQTEAASLEDRPKRKAGDNASRKANKPAANRSDWLMWSLIVLFVFVLLVSVVVAATNLLG